MGRPATVVLLLLLLSALTFGQLTGAKIDTITRNMQQYRKNWKIEDTISLLNGGDPPGTALHLFVNQGTRTGNIIDDNGNSLPAMLTGSSLLINGKDISGNLGSKTTYGTNSPIIEDVSNSTVSTGDKSPIAKDVTASFSLNLTLHWHSRSVLP